MTLQLATTKAVFQTVFIVCLGLGWPSISAAKTPGEIIDKLNKYPHATTVAQSETQVRDHEIGLGAMKKIRGVWQFKSSERLSGVLLRNTWQIVDGFTSLEVFSELVTEVESTEGSELLFSCEGRSCGQGVQWANRVFGEKILYGREEMQRYRVYSLDKPATGRVILYSAARTADRQYLHMEFLQVQTETLSEEAP